MRQTSQTMQTAARIGGFCARHVLALGVTVAAACVVWTVTYFALLLWAVVTGGGLGGPLAYPSGLLFFFVATTAAGLVLLFPSTVLAEWLARRRGFPVLAQIPASVAVLALLCAIGGSLVAAWRSQPPLHGVTAGGGVLFLALLVPLGLYWWAAQSGPLLLSLFRWVRSLPARSAPATH